MLPKPAAPINIQVPKPAAAAAAPTKSMQEQDEDSDDSDDLPPPLEPMPFVAAENKLQKAAKDAGVAPGTAFPKPAPPINIKVPSLPAPAVEKPKTVEEKPKVAEAPKPTLIGPPKPEAKSSKSKPKKEQESKSGRPAYLDKDLQEFPLFLDKLPKEASDNPDIAALQALAAEETPEERAEHFKNSGNECMQHGGPKWWDDAIEYYTRAIQCGSRDYPKVSIYFSNRAAVQILKKNWGHAARDCLEALELDPGNVKAMYRASKSYYELRKLPEALKYLRMAMAKARTAQLVELEKDIARRMRKERLKDEKRNKEMEDTMEKELDRSKTLRERGYRFSNDDIYEAKERMDQYGCKISLEENQDPRTGKTEMEVTMPVVIVYPQSRQSDFVQQWNEKLFIRDMLEMLLKEGAGAGGRDWDQWGLYSAKEVGNMCVYVKTNDRFDTYEKQEWVRVKLSSTLQEAITCHPNYIIPVVPVFFVFHVNFKNTFFEKECQAQWGTPAHRIEN